MEIVLPLVAVPTTYAGSEMTPIWGLMRHVQLQTIEIYTPNRDANGNFPGLNHEAIFHDPEALVEPVRIIRNYVKLSDFDEGDPYVFIECTQTIDSAAYSRPYSRRRRCRVWPC